MSTELRLLIEEALGRARADKMIAAANPRGAPATTRDLSIVVTALEGALLRVRLVCEIGPAL